MTSKDIDHLFSEKGKTHGSFITHATVTQDLKAVINHHLLDQNRKLEADMAEALDMICHRIGRIIAGSPDFADHWLGIAGYAYLIARHLQDVDPF